MTLEPLFFLEPGRAFALGSALASTGWLALALSPRGVRWAAAARRYAGRVVPLVLAAVYVVLVVRHWGPGGFGSLADVRALFAVPGLLAAGWLHYLAFDLFVGAWIAERAAALALPHAVVVPLLLATFLFGPAGLLGFAAVRAVRTRLGARPAAATVLEARA